MSPPLDSPLTEKSARTRTLQRKEKHDFTADGANLMTWRSKLAKFLEHQYQRTSIPTLIVSLFTLGVATTGLIYTVANYNNQQIAQAEDQRQEVLRNNLRNYYTEVTELITENTQLPPDISKDELHMHLQKASEFMERVYQWSKQNLGDAAANTLTEGQPTMTYGAAHGSQELNNLLNTLFSFRDDIKKLIDSNMWNRMQK
jgi:type II secretory pathway pseudopilin PulG